MNDKIKKWGGNFFRLLISAALIFWLFTFVDVAVTLEKLKKTDIHYLLGSVLLFISALFVFSFRWKTIVNSFSDQPIRLVTLLKYYWIGLFFNNFFPTSIGGDVIRAYYISHDIKNKGQSFASVAIERILGFIITSLIGLVAILILNARFPIKFFGTLTVFLIIFLLILLAIIFSNIFFSILTGWLERIKFFQIGEKLKEIFSVFRGFKDRPAVLVKAFIITFSGQLLIICFNFTIYFSLSGKADFLPFLFVVPLTIIASLFPSINGLGTREAAYVLLLGLFGVSKEISLALAVIVFIVPLFISIWGGVYYIFNPVSLRSVAWKNQVGS